MMHVKHLLVVVGLIGAAGAGAYGQGLIKPEAPSRDVIQLGILYEGSFCGDRTSFGARFEFHATRFLNGNWFEAEYGYTNRETGEFTTPPETARFNLVQLCYVKPIVKPFVR